MSQEQIYLAKCKRVGKCLLEMRELLLPVKILVYGSVARGHIGMSSDIDILVVSAHTPAEMPAVRKEFLRKLPDFVDAEFPYADVKLAAECLFENPDDSEYGDYIRNCQKEGIVIWKQEPSST